MTEKVRNSINPNKKLTEEEVYKACMLVEKKHPLMDVPLWKVLPFLRPFKPCLKDSVAQTFAMSPAEALDGNERVDGAGDEEVGGVSRVKQGAKKLFAIATGAAIAQY